MQGIQSINVPSLSTFEKTVCTDGHTYNGNRDPPGQLSAYIPPGDERKEVYRCSTFTMFPRDVPITPKELASNGFLYTGYKDRVKCFRCGMSVENWMVGDDVKSPRWHRSDCQFALGADTTNIPIKNFMTFLLNTAATNASATALSQPFSNGTATSTSSNSPAATSLPGSQTLPKTSTSEFRTTSPQLGAENRAGFIAETRNAETHEHIFPCHSPVNPHMRSTAARLQTFHFGSGTEWIEGRIRATPAQIAEAGFFFLGERDRAKCWYCNGGLQNWEYNDDPWFEHAKWFPSCEFLLSKKGIDFVQNITDRFPNLNRPQIGAPQRASLTRSGVGGRSPIRAPDIVDPRVEMRIRDDKISSAMSNSTIVRQALAIGYSESAVKAALTKKYDLTTMLHQNIESLLDDLRNGQPSVPEEDPNASNDGMDTSFASLSTHDRLKTLEQSRNCKICRVHASDVVMVPCGHLASCLPCAEGARYCPICKASVREKIKTFRA